MENSYKEGEESKNIAPEVINLITGKDGSSISLEKGKEKVIKYIELVLNNPPFHNADEFCIAADNLAILAKYIDIGSIIDNNYIMFYDKILACLQKNTPGKHYLHAFNLLANISIKSPQASKSLISFGFLNLVKEIITQSFPVSSRVKAYEVLSAISFRSDNDRNSVLNVFPMRTLYYSSLVENSGSLFESMMKLACVCTKYALDIKEVDFAFKTLKFAFVNDGKKEVTLKAKRYAIRGIYFLVGGKISYKEYFDYHKSIVSFFASDPVITEYICYIEGEYASSKQMPLVPMAALADIIEEDNSPPLLISAAARCIGLVILNLPQSVEDMDNIDFLQRMCAVFSRSQFSAKEELGFAIIAITSVIGQDDMLEITMDEFSEYLHEIFILKNKHTLKLAASFLNQMYQTASWKGKTGEFEEFLEKSEIFSAIQDIANDNDKETKLEKELDEITSKIIEKYNEDDDD